MFLTLGNAPFPRYPVFMSRRAPARLVSDCLLVITPVLLRLPEPADLRVYQFSRLPGAQIRYSVRLGVDGLPEAVILPRQPVVLAPEPRWIPEQVVSCCSTAMHNPCSGLRRQWWFVCPSENCCRRCGGLYLPDGADRWLCSLCHRLTYDQKIYQCLYRELRRRGLPRSAYSDLGAIVAALTAPGSPPPPISVWPTLLRWSQIGEGGGKQVKRRPN